MAYATQAERDEAHARSIAKTKAAIKAEPDWYRDLSPINMTEGEEYHGVADMHCYVDVPELVSQGRESDYYHYGIWGDRPVRPWSAMKHQMLDRTVRGSQLQVENNGLSLPERMTGEFTQRYLNLEE